MNTGLIRFFLYFFLQSFIVNQKNLIQVAPFKVEVLGGFFLVDAIQVDPDQKESEIRQLIRETDRDMWFVIVGDSLEQEPDYLSIFDEDLNFRSVAIGTFESTL